MKAPPGELLDHLRVPRNDDDPPLHLWHPECHGDIPIVINAQGDWYHDGGKIQRESMVRLFASILRRESDGAYYLVTPQEKWRIAVERHALLITDINKVSVDGDVLLQAQLNTGKQLVINETQCLFLDPIAGGIAAMQLPHGLTALCTRAAWYRLVAMSSTGEGAMVLRSGTYTFQLHADVRSQS